VITTSIRVVGALGFDGMANRCELPINAVKANKPKMLRGLNQKVRDGHEGIQFPSSETTPSPANRQGPNPSRHTSGTWKVRNSPNRESEPQGTPMELRIEEDGGSERSPVMGEIGIALSARSSHAKAGRLPSGLSSRERTNNRQRRKSR
jgi:hypothetical protein